MMKLLSSLALAASLLCTTTYGTPWLQLDASNSTYDPVTQTTIANGPIFTVYALVDTTSPNTPNTATFYISAALTPKPTNQAQGTGDFGSFTFNGNVIDATADMTWGTPTNLPQHGVYDTYYTEFAFTFSTIDGTNLFMNYNVEDVIGTHVGPTTNAGGNARYAAFSVDLSDLAGTHGITFDLYTYDGGKAEGKKARGWGKAPFSHDASGGGNTVPDGGMSAILLGAGLIALGLLRRKLA